MWFHKLYEMSWSQLPSATTTKSLSLRATRYMYLNRGGRSREKKHRLLDSSRIWAENEKRKKTRKFKAITTQISSHIEWIAHSKYYIVHVELTSGVFERSRTWLLPSDLAEFSMFALCKQKSGNQIMHSKVGRTLSQRFDVVGYKVTSFSFSIARRKRWRKYFYF